MTANEDKEHWDRIRATHLGFINRLELALGYTPTEDIDHLSIADLAVMMNHAAVRIERLHESLSYNVVASVTRLEIDDAFKAGYEKGRKHQIEIDTESFGPRIDPTLDDAIEEWRGTGYITK